MGTRLTEHDAFVAAVAEQLRAEKAARDLTLDGLRDSTGMGRSTVDRLLKGAVPADTDQLARLARAFGLTVTELIKRAEDRQRGRAVSPSRTPR